ncbi:MAG: EamA/RhaT family transporter [Ignavibacteriales bacterium]|jgi:drug/metabolite transporter (DMT)-like permease|nr:MAG: EamA/RhaT family transporter [Ignavibacteriales bacterium]
MSRFAPVFIIVAASLWGIDGIVLRPTLYSLPVGLVVFIESSIVAILLSPIFLKQYGKLKSLTLADWGSFVGVALFGGAIGTMAITKALFYVDFVNLSIVILIQKLQPVFALILAGLILKERLPRIFFLWAAIAISGAYLMTFGFKMPIQVNEGNTAMAAMYSIIAALSFASSTVFSKRALRNVGFELGTYLRFAISSIIMLIIVLPLGQLPQIAEVTTDQFLIFLLIAFTTGGAAIFLYYYGLKIVTASVATICEMAFPLTAVILEYLLRDNILDPVQWIGVAILLYSIFKVTRMSQERIKGSSIKK